MSTLESRRRVVGGVDTHGDVHVAAAINEVGGVLATSSFPTTPAGYRDLLAWLRAHGEVALVGVEGTGAYGAGLARFLATRDVRVVEVDRPNRQERRRQGKTDALDAPGRACGTLGAVPGRQGPHRSRRGDPGPARRAPLGDPGAQQGPGADAPPLLHRPRRAARAIRAYAVDGLRRGGRPAPSRRGPHGRERRPRRHCAISRVASSASTPSALSWSSRWNS